MEEDPYPGGAGSITGTGSVTAGSPGGSWRQQQNHGKTPQTRRRTRPTGVLPQVFVPSLLMENEGERERHLREATTGRKVRPNISMSVGAAPAGSSSLSARDRSSGSRGYYYSAQQKGKRGGKGKGLTGGEGSMVGTLVGSKDYLSQLELPESVLHSVAVLKGEAPPAEMIATEGTDDGGPPDERQPTTNATGTLTLTSVVGAPPGPIGTGIQQSPGGYNRHRSPLGRSGSENTHQFSGSGRRTASLSPPFGGSSSPEEIPVARDGGGGGDLGLGRSPTSPRPTQLPPLARRGSVDPRRRISPSTTATCTGGTSPSISPPQQRRKERSPSIAADASQQARTFHKEVLHWNREEFYHTEHGKHCVEKDFPYMHFGDTVSALQLGSIQLH